MAKEELCDKVVEVRRVSDRVMTVFEEDVLKLICVYAPQSGSSWKINSLIMVICKMSGIYKV